MPYLKLVDRWAHSNQLEDAYVAREMLRRLHSCYPDLKSLTLIMQCL